MDDVTGEAEVMRQAALCRRLAELRTEHRDLDQVIEQISGRSAHDQLQLQRLKKRKLVLKDLIARIESDLIPDITA